MSLKTPRWDHTLRCKKRKKLACFTVAVKQIVLRSCCLSSLYARLKKTDRTTLTEIWVTAEHWLVICLTILLNRTGFPADHVASSVYLPLGETDQNLFGRNMNSLVLACLIALPNHAGFPLYVLPDQHPCSIPRSCCMQQPAAHDLKTSAAHGLCLMSLCRCVWMMWLRYFLLVHFKHFFYLLVTALRWPILVDCQCTEWSEMEL